MISDNYRIIKAYKEILINYKNSLDSISLDSILLDNISYNNRGNSIESISTQSISSENSEANNTNDYPCSGEILGLIYIEKILLELPIIEDSNDENLWLGATHIRGSPLYWEKATHF